MHDGLGYGGGAGGWAGGAAGGLPGWGLVKCGDERKY